MSNYLGIRNDAQSIRISVGVPTKYENVLFSALDPTLSTVVTPKTEISSSTVDYSSAHHLRTNGTSLLIDFESFHYFEGGVIPSGHSYEFSSTLYFKGPIAQITNNEKEPIPIFLKTSPNPLTRRSRFVWIDQHLIVVSDPKGAEFSLHVNNFSWARRSYRTDLPAGATATVLVNGSIRTTFGSFIPEPSTWAMLIAGFGLVGWKVRRATKTSQRLLLAQPD